MSLDDKPVVELESVDYILCDRQSVPLSELPEWWYSSTVSNHAEHDGYRECSDNSIHSDLSEEKDSFLVDSTSNDNEEIKILNTFSLAPNASPSSQINQALKRKLDYVTPSEVGGKLVKYDEVDGVIFTSFRSEDVVKCFDESINVIEENSRFWSFFQLMSSYKAQLKSGKQPVINKNLKSSRKGKGFRGVTSKIRKFDKCLEMKLIKKKMVIPNQLLTEALHDVSPCSNEVQNRKKFSPPHVQIDPRLIKQEETISGEEYFHDSPVFLEKDPISSVESSSNSIFCSQELDECLSSETKNLRDKPFFKVEKLKAVHTDVRYETPIAQSGYIKTLKSALNHVKPSGKDGNHDQLLMYPHTDLTHTSSNESSAIVSLLEGTSSGQSRKSPRKFNLLDYCEKVYPMKCRLQPSKFHLARKTEIFSGNGPSAHVQQCLNAKEKNIGMIPFCKVPFLPKITVDRARHAVLAIEPIKIDLTVNSSSQDSSFAIPEQTTCLADQDAIGISKNSKDRNVSSDYVTNNTESRGFSSKEENAGNDPSLKKLHFKILIRRLVSRLGKSRVQELRRLKKVHVGGLQKKVEPSSSEKDIDCPSKCARSLVYKRKSPGTCECGDHHRWKCFAKRSKHKKRSHSKEDHHSSNNERKKCKDDVILENIHNEESTTSLCKMRSRSKEDDLSSNNERKKCNHPINQSKTISRKEEYGLNQLFNADVAPPNYQHKNFLLSKSWVDKFGVSITKVFKIMSRCSGWVFDDVFIAMFKLDSRIREKKFLGYADMVLSKKYSIMLLVKANNKQESESCLPNYILENIHNEECTASLVCIHETKAATILPKGPDERIMYCGHSSKTIRNLLEMEKYAFENTTTDNKKDEESSKDLERWRQIFEVSKSKLVLNETTANLEPSVIQDKIQELASLDSSSVTMSSEASGFRKHYHSGSAENTVIDLTGNDAEMEPGIESTSFIFPLSEVAGSLDERNSNPEKDNGLVLETPFLNCDINVSCSSTSVDTCQAAASPLSVYGKQELSCTITSESSTSMAADVVPENHIDEPFVTRKISLDPSTLMTNSFDFTTASSADISSNVNEGSPLKLKEFEIVMTSTAVCVFPSPVFSTTSPSHELETELVSSSHVLASAIVPQTSACSSWSNIGGNFDISETSVSKKVYDSDSSINLQEQLTSDSVDNPSSSKVPNVKLNSSVAQSSLTEFTANPPKESVAVLSDHPNVTTVSTSAAPISHVKCDSVRINLLPTNPKTGSCKKSKLVAVPLKCVLLPKSTTTSTTVVQSLSVQTHTVMPVTGIISMEKGNASGVPLSSLNLSRSIVKVPAMKQRNPVPLLPRSASVIIIPNSNFVSDVKTQMPKQKEKALKQQAQGCLNVLNPGNNLYLQKVPLDSVPLPILVKKSLAKSFTGRSSVSTVSPSGYGNGVVMKLSNPGIKKTGTRPCFSPSLSSWLSQNSTKKTYQVSAPLTSAPSQSGDSTCVSVTSAFQVADAPKLFLNVQEDPMLSESFRSNMRLFMPSFFSTANSQLDTFVASQSTNTLQNTWYNKVTKGDVGFPVSSGYATFCRDSAISKPVVSLSNKTHIIMPSFSSVIMSQAETTNVISNEKCRSVSTITTPIASTRLSQNEPAYPIKTFTQYKNITSLLGMCKRPGEFQILSPSEGEGVASTPNCEKRIEYDKHSRNIFEELSQDLGETNYEQIEVDEIGSFVLDREEIVMDELLTRDSTNTTDEQKSAAGRTKEANNILKYKHSKTDRVNQDDLSDIDVTGVASHNLPSNIVLLKHLTSAQPKERNVDDAKQSECSNWKDNYVKIVQHLENDNERESKSVRERCRRFRLSESIKRLRFIIGTDSRRSKLQVMLQATEECNELRREEKYLLDYKEELKEEQKKLRMRMKELHSTVYPRIMH